jgi:hypothetical protein
MQIKQDTVFVVHLLTWHQQIPVLASEYVVAVCWFFDFNQWPNESLFCPDS